MVRAVEGVLTVWWTAEYVAFLFIFYIEMKLVLRYT